MASRPFSPAPPGRPRPRAVGIDVVDLDDPRCRGKAGDQRFLRRVFSEAEARAVREADDGDARLWALWAAKEAAFKVVSKTEGAPPPFVHAAFEADVPGRVRWQGTEVPVRVERKGRAVVALAWEAGGGAAAPVWEARLAEEVDPDPGLPLEALVERHLAPAERPPVHSRPSALVRIGGRAALARALGVTPGRVAVVCPGGPTGRTPPRATLDNGPAPADVSLSHHGAWVAWAVRVSRGSGETPEVRDRRDGS